MFLLTQGYTTPRTSLGSAPKTLSAMTSDGYASPAVSVKTSKKESGVSVANKTGGADRYREYLPSVLSIKTPKQAPGALAKLFAAKLLNVGPEPSHEEYVRILKAAWEEFGGTVGTFLQYHENARQWQAVAVHRKNGACVVVETAPASITTQTLVVHGKELALTDGMPTLFRVSTWLARTVFGMQDGNPFPLLHKLAHEQLDYLRGTAACYDTSYDTGHLVRALDMYVRSVAFFSDQLDYEEATIVDILHCFGCIYIGSLNEITSEEEGVHLRTSLALARVHGGYTHYWWIEDFTLFKEDEFTLAIRYTIENKPFYMKRRLVLDADGSRFKDMETGSLSNAMSWETRIEAGASAFNKWVESFLPRCAKAMPYMRYEIVHRYHVLRPRRFLFMVRPYLVKGHPGFLPPMHNSHLAARLFYSPDLFVECRKIPEGAEPTTVMAQVQVRPWIEDAEFQLFLRIQGEDRHVFRVLFHKNGELLPEVNQLRVFVQSKNPERMEKDVIQVIVLKRSVAPCGTILVEFVITTYCRPFRVYVDNTACDYTFRLTSFKYSASHEPVVFPPIYVPVFTNKVHYVAKKFDLPMDKAIPKAAQMITREKRAMIPLVFAEALAENTYAFDYYDGANLVRMKPSDCSSSNCWRG